MLLSGLLYTNTNNLMKKLILVLPFLSCYLFVATFSKYVRFNVSLSIFNIFLMDNYENNFCFMRVMYVCT